MPFVLVGNFPWNIQSTQFFLPVDSILYLPLCTRHSLSVHRGWFALMIYCWNICWTFKLAHRSHCWCRNVYAVIKTISLYMQIKWPFWCPGNISEAVQLTSCGVHMMEHISCTCFTALYPSFTSESSLCRSFICAFSVHADYFVWQRVLPVLFVRKMLPRLNIHLCIRRPRPFCICPAV